MKEPGNEAVVFPCAIPHIQQLAGSSLYLTYMMGTTEREHRRREAVVRINLCNNFHNARLTPLCPMQKLSMELECSSNRARTGELGHGGVYPTLKNGHLMDSSPYVQTHCPTSQVNTSCESGTVHLFGHFGISASCLHPFAQA